MTEAQLKHAGQYACTLADTLLAKENVQFHPAVIRNRRFSICRHRSDTYQLIFSWEMLQCCYEEGYPWWKINLRVWPRKAAGLRGIHRHILHEVAHVRQIRNGERWRGSVHNAYFVKRLRELAREVPFESHQESRRLTG